MLLIRQAAIGDVAITLPVARALKDAFPGVHVAFLTTPTCAPLARAVAAIDEVRTVSTSGGRIARMVASAAAGIAVRGAYDVVIDLQRNRESRCTRRLARPTAWSEFERFTPRQAFDRVSRTVQAAFPELPVPLGIGLREEVAARGLLRLTEAGWDGRTPLIALNPGGFFANRSWPIDRYAALARTWGAEARFLLAGDARIAAKAAYLRSQIGPAALDLVGRTSLDEALAVVQRASLVISEDGGLMHMAWLSGVPVVALLGSTRSDWVRPVGPRARWIGSDDLSCGNCMQAVCPFGDAHCMTRIAVGAVRDLAREAMGAV